MKLGDVAIAYVDIMISAAQQLGCDTDKALTQYNILPKALVSADARISIAKFMRLGHHLIAQKRVPWLGLEMGRVTLASHLGLAGLLAFSATNLQQAFSQLVKFEPLSSVNIRGQSKCQLVENRLVISFYSIDPYNDYNYFVVDSVLTSWFYLAQALSGRTDMVEAVHFEFEQPSYFTRYRDYFSCPVLFNQRANQLVLKAGYHQSLCKGSCPSTNQLLMRKAQDDLDKLKKGQRFSEQVAHAISPLLTGMTPTLAQVATQLNMAPWTLRRQLIADGSSFQQVLNDTRAQLARSYVCDTEISLGEIAYLLGFSSPAAFQRAFKRWLGQAPGCYRQQHKIANN